MAKFCKNCGKELKDAAKFCTSCGAKSEPPEQPQQPTPVQPMQQTQPQYQRQYIPIPNSKPKSQTPLIIAGVIGGVCVFALVIVLIVISITGLFGNSDFVDTGGNTKSSGSKKSTGDDAISMNALVGSWFHYDGWFSAYLWKFDADGNYARFKVSQSGYTNDVGTTWYSAYGNIMTGKYRVRGYVIELYNNQHSSQFSKDYNIGSVPPHNTAVSKLPPLSDPSKVEDLTLEFEFTDAITLRLASARPLYDDYDVEFEYYGEDSHDVTIPKHSIPSRECPGVFAKADIPEYGSGRIRDVRNRMNGERLSEILVEIDRSTPEYYKSWIDRLIQNGWTLDSEWCDYYYVYEKDGYNLTIDMYHRDKESGEAIRPGRFVYITLWTTWGDINDLNK